jgi:transcription elongation factor GreA
MRVPIRKGSNRLSEKIDPVMTEEKYQELRNKLDFWKKVKRPREAEEVKRLALMGDFSENTGYQLAKGRLRGLNQRILDTENLLTRAEIVETPSNSSEIQIGSTITIINEDQEKIYKILGSSESDPKNGIISHVSPLGEALIGRTAGEIVTIVIGGKEKKYKIIKIV